MDTPSRTPEGIPGQCPICGHRFNAVVSDPAGDVPCPNCGHLMWPAGIESVPGNKTDVRHQIHRILGRVATIAREEPEQEQMADALLSSAITALAAVGGSITTLDEDGRMSPCYIVNRIHYSKMPPEFGDFRRDAITRTWETSSPQCFTPIGDSEINAPANPSQYLMLYAPLKHYNDEKPTAVMEIMQRPTVGPAARRGMMRFSTEMCDNVSRYFRFNNDG